MVVIGVDTHKRTHTLVLVDEAGRRLGERTLPATSEGHLQAARWAGQWPGARFALDDCRHLTRRLEGDLLAAGRGTRFRGRSGQGFDEGDHGVKSYFKRSGGAMDLAKQQSSLSGRQGREREVVRVGICGKMPAVLHGVKAAADPRVPPLEPGRDLGSGLLVLVSEFAGQRSDRAAAPALGLALHLHHAVPPGPQPLDAVELARVRVPGCRRPGRPGTGSRRAPGQSCRKSNGRAVMRSPRPLP